MKLEEIWRDIVGWEGLYQVSNIGRVRSLDARFNHHYGSRLRRGKMKSLAISTTGYYTVNLFRDNKIKVLKVHRELMKAFVPNPENKKTVNHIDGNKLNNHISNLDWNTHKENARHAHDTGLIKKIIGEDNAAAKLTNIDIYEIRLLEQNGVRPKTLSKVFVIHEIYIAKIVSGKAWNHI